MDRETEDVLDVVGARLRALRRARGLTLADLAASTGVSESTLSRLEGALRTGPSPAAAPAPSRVPDHGTPSNM